MWLNPAVNRTTLGGAPTSPASAERDIPEHVAQFAINTTASAILLLVQDTR